MTNYAYPMCQFLFSPYRLQASCIILTIRFSYRMCRRLLVVAGVRAGVLALVLASCAPEKTTEPLITKPTQASLQPEVSFRTLRSFPTDEARLPEPYIERGTGDYVTTSPGTGVAPNVQSNKSLSLNFVDIDIRELLGKILGDQLKLDYIIDPKIEGRITVRTSDELASDDVLSILDSVLNLNGAALVEDSGIYKVLPMDQVIGSGIVPEIRRDENVGKLGFGIEIVPIKYISTDNLAEILEPLLSNDSKMQINSRRKTVLLVGPRSELNTLVSTIKIFDVDWMNGMSFGLFDIKYAEAANISKELGQIFAGFADMEAANIIRFIPIERLNSIIVVAAQPSYLDRAREWIERLDKVAEGSGEQVYYYSVQNGRATDLAEVLSSIFEIEKRIVGESDSSRNFHKSRNGFDPIEFEGSFDEDARTFDEYALYMSNQSQYHGLDYFPTTNESTNREARIVADENNNSLLIRATSENYRKIQSAIREIDVRPVQVLLEATIAEVTLKDELSFGVQWFFQNGSNNLTLSNILNGAVEQSFPGFSGIFSTNDKRIVFDALDSISDVRIVSSPQLLVLDNQTAQLEVGDEVPIVVQQTQGIDDPDGRLINTIEQRQTGVILNVTPRVNASGLVVLDIQQEVSDVVQTTTSGIDSPTISQRRIGTSIAVGNRQTVALGGLIRDRTAKSQLGVPLLSSIPILGLLFGATNDVTTRTELLVLITPNVVRDHLEAQAVTDEIRKRFQAVTRLEKKLNRAE